MKGYGIDGVQWLIARWIIRGLKVASIALALGLAFYGLGIISI